MAATLLRILTTATFIGYPVAVFYGMRSGHIALWLGGACVCLAPTLYFRMRSAQANDRRPGFAHLRALAFLPIVTLAMLAMSAALRTAGLALATPSSINLALLAIFGWTLRTPTPMIERFARLIDPDLTPAQCVWCRLWTHIWCAFFLLNAAVCALMAILAPVLWWSLYTSLLAYIAMGILFAAERIGRWYKFERTR